jgi:hypothetical protein
VGILQLNLELQFIVLSSVIVNLEISSAIRKSNYYSTIKSIFSGRFLFPNKNAIFATAFREKAQGIIF